MQNVYIGRRIYFERGVFQPATASGAAHADLAAVAHAAHRLDGQDEAHGAVERALGLERTRADPPSPPEARAASTGMDGLRGSLDRGPAARHSDSRVGGGEGAVLPVACYV